MNKETHNKLTEKYFDNHLKHLQTATRASRAIRGARETQEIVIISRKKRGKI